MFIATAWRKLWPSVYQYILTLFGHKPRKSLDDHSGPKSKLLALPPELRNKIYRLVLIQSDKTSFMQGNTITFDANNHTEPALLQVCRQTRSESKNIFRNENSFSIITQDMEPRMPLKKSGHWIWNTQIVLTDYCGSPNWANFEQWAHHYYMGERLGATAAESVATNGLPAYTMSSVAANAFALVDAMKARGASWKEIEVVLKTYKKGIDGSHGATSFWT